MFIIDIYKSSPLKRNCHNGNIDSLEVIYMKYLPQAKDGTGICLCILSVFMVLKHNPLNFTAILAMISVYRIMLFRAGNNSCLSIRKINKQSVDLYHLLKENIPVGIST